MGLATVLVWETGTNLILGRGVGVYADFVFFCFFPPDVNQQPVWTLESQLYRLIDFSL